MRSINHDTIKLDSFLLRETDSQFEMFGTGSVIEVDSDGDGSVVGSERGSC